MTKKQTVTTTITAVSESDSTTAAKNAAATGYPPTPIVQLESEMEEKLRYSDKELKEFKELIHEKLSKARKDYELLLSSVNNTGGNDTEDTAPTFNVLEEGASALSKEEAGQLALRQQKFITSLEAALIRIENKTYGICRETGKLIPKERLLSVPHATLSIEAKAGK